MTASVPDVSVVIPSQGGPLLSRAVSSALVQTEVTLEVIVVLNGAAHPVEFDDERVHVLTSAASDGANGARQAGINAARAPYVALLDDDDQWMPAKLITQLNQIRQLESRSSLPWIVGCRLLERRPDGNEVATPKRDFGQVSRIDRYLFERTTLRSDRHQLQTSTIMFPTDLGRTVVFDVSRKFHQDWTWLLNAQAAGSSAFVVPEVLVHRNVQDGGSIGSKITWQGSLDWAGEFLDDQRLAGDFALTMASLKAVRAADVRGLVACVGWGFRNGRPSAPALVFWLSRVPPTVRSSLVRRVNRGAK